MVESVQELYHLFADAIQGEYRLHPTSLVVIAGGLLYFVVPVDLIPDVLPIIGLVDDLAVLSTVINSMQTELDAYRRWKGNATAA
jgi:uncharacterized membrane protein YkvA (DUF1232 family)